MSPVASVPLIAVLIAAGLAGAAQGQLRPSNVEVLTPAAVQPTPPPPDAAPLLAQSYRRAGKPRIVLLWNRELSDRVQAEGAERTVVRETGQVARRASAKAGAPMRRVWEETLDHTTTMTHGNVATPEPARRTVLAERDAKALERGFVSEMNRAGVRFVDRALVIRQTAADTHRDGGDARLIETDALQSRAALLMEVVLVRDEEAPAGYAFDLRIKDLRSSQELASLYTVATPPATEPPVAGAWVAGEAGYEFRAPPAAPAPSPMLVGATLAQEAMQPLEEALQERQAGAGR